MLHVEQNRRQEFTGASRFDDPPILQHLETLWRAYGDDPYFYDRYYLPTAQRLTGYELGRAGMPIDTQRLAGEGAFFVSLQCWTQHAIIHYTTDGSPPSAKMYRSPESFRSEAWRSSRSFRSP